MNDQGSSGCQRLIGLAKEHHLFVQVPVVEDMPHDDHITFRQWIFEEVSCVKPRTWCDASRLRIGLEYRLHYWQIHTAAHEMLVRTGDFDRHSALGAADIHECAVLLPGKLLRDDLRGTYAETGHGLEKAFQPLRIGIQGAEEVPAGLHFVLRLTGAETFGQRIPESIEPRITHFEYAADIRGFRAIEKQRSFGRIGVTRACPLEHAERDQRIEKVARAAGMELEPLGQGCRIERTFR